MPDLDVYRPFLRPEFLAALEVLFSSFESNVATLPVRQSSARSSDLQRFYSIMKSNLFNDYRNAHLVIDDPKKSLSDHVRQVSATARELTRGYSDQISLQSLVLSGLSVTGYAVELFLGKLPATAVSPFKHIFQSYFIDDHRVVMYDFGTVWSLAFRQQIEALVQTYPDTSSKI